MRVTIDELCGLATLLNGKLTPEDFEPTCFAYTICEDCPRYVLKGGCYGTIKHDREYELIDGWRDHLTHIIERKEFMND